MGGVGFKDYSLMRNNSSEKWKKWRSYSKSNNEINMVWPLKYVIYKLLSMLFIILLYMVVFFFFSVSFFIHPMNLSEANIADLNIQSRDFL